MQNCHSFSPKVYSFYTLIFLKKEKTLAFKKLRTSKPIVNIYEIVMVQLIYNLYKKELTLLQ